MKTKYLYRFMLLFLIFSCSTSQEIKEIKTLKFNSGSYVIKLPHKTFKEKIIEIGISELEYQYIFNDSSKIYCTDHESSSALIHRFLTQKDYISFLDNDTLFLSFSENNKHYSIRKVGKIFIGYSGVRKENKEMFDNTINMLKKK